MVSILTIRISVHALRIVAMQCIAYDSNNTQRPPTSGRIDRLVFVRKILFSMRYEENFVLFECDWPVDSRVRVPIIGSRYSDGLRSLDGGRGETFCELNLRVLNLRGLCAVSSDDDNNNDNQFPFIYVPVLVREKLLGSGK